MKGLKKGYGLAARMGCLALCAILCACFLGCGPSRSPVPQVVITPFLTAAAPGVSPTPLPTQTPPPTQTPLQTEMLVPTKTPQETEASALTQMPPVTEGPTETPEAKKPLSGLVVGVDPGHQKRSNKELEPVAPGSSDMKKKVSAGTRGVSTGIYEYQVNLAVGLLLRDMLEEAGATVVMTHTTADVDISNIQRAELFNDKMVDLGVRLHCDGSLDQSVRGAFMLVPKSRDYPYYDDCVLAAKAILKAYGAETGLDVSKGITYRSDQAGFNWCTRPVTNIEMGHMTNPEEDRLLTDADFQVKMARGVFSGIVAYFAAKAG
ncbi:MAG TPA: N-acetylmuramoyl-L-alanine amidase [Clostridia bacterium]|nr:N-acetylmuramoyl-L-alanine amidase [Clostridia bacterium]